MPQKSRLHGKCTSYWCRFCGTDHKQFPCLPFGLWHPIVSCLYGNPPHRGPCEPPGPGGWWPDVKREAGEAKWCWWMVFRLGIDWDWIEWRIDERVFVYFVKKFGVLTFRGPERGRGWWVSASVRQIWFNVHLLFFFSSHSLPLILIVHSATIRPILYNSSIFP